MMDREFLSECSAIAPLVGDAMDGDAPLPTIEVPDVPDYIVHSVIDRVKRGDPCRLMTMQHCLDALKIGDFLGHERMIRDAAEEIASRLRGLSRDEMMTRLNLYMADDEVTPVMDLEIRRDITWITKARESWTRSSCP